MSDRSQSATACATSSGGGGGIDGVGARTAASSTGGGDRAGGVVCTGDGVVAVGERAARGERGDAADIFDGEAGLAAGNALILSSDACASALDIV